MKIFQPQSGGGGGGGTISGTIAANQVAFGTSLDNIGGNNNHTIDATNGELYLGNDIVVMNNPVFSGAGLDDLSVNDGFTGAAGTVYTITIASMGTPDTFTWTNSAGGSGGPTSITGSDQTLNDGLKISFDSTTGHTAGNSWTITAITTTTSFSTGINLLGLGAKGISQAYQDSTNSLIVANILGNVVGSPDSALWGVLSTGGSNNARIVSRFSNGNGALNFDVNNGGTHYQLNLNTVDGLNYDFGGGSYTFPNSNSTGTQFLANNGSGTLSWQTVGGGGSPGGANTNIQFNDSSSFGGVSAFTFDKASNTFDVTGSNAKFVVNGNAGGITAQVDNLNSFAIQNAANQLMFLANNFGMGPNLELGDIANGFNHTKFSVNDVSSLITGFGNKVISYPTPTPSFTGGGLDDLSIGGTFSGMGTVSYTITVDNINTQEFNITAQSAAFNIGDTITNGTGGSGVALDDGLSGRLHLKNVTGTFSNGDAISGNISGSTATISSVPSTLSDTYDWNDGSGSNPGNSMSTPNTISNGVTVNFGAATGHTVGNFWTFTYTPSTAYGTMLSLDGANNRFKMGDIDGIGAHTILDMDDSSKRAILGSLTGTAYIDVNGSGGTSKLGDVSNLGNSTLLTVDDANKAINLNADIASGQITATSFINWSIADFISFRNPANSTQNFFNANWNSGNPHIDFGGNGNLTGFTLDDSAQRVTLDNIVKFEVLNGVDSMITANWASGNPNVLLGAGGYGNNTSFSIDDSIRKLSIVAGNQVLYTTDGTNKILDLNPSSHYFEFGDISHINSGNKVRVDDANNVILAVSREFKVTDTSNNAFLDIDSGNSLYQIGDVSNSVNGTKISINDTSQNILLQGTLVETNIGSTTYGGTLNYSAGFVGKARAFFTGSHSGTATGLLLPTGVNAPIGTKFTIDDLGGLATTDPITVDAGTSNTITSPLGTAQTFVINSNGESLTIVKLTSTDWMVE